METQPKQVPVFTGGGGADASHGLSYHLAVAILLLFCLKDANQEDLALQYEIGLEKKGYDKFDDIVVRYKQSDKKWIEICIQCKHGEEKLIDGEIIVKEITAFDFLSGKNKSFSLVEYIKSYTIVKENFSDEIERFFVILSNKPYSISKDDMYPCFKREKNIDFNGIFVSKMFPKLNFKLKYSDELTEIIRKTSKYSLERDILKEFCNNFIYIYDNRNLESEIWNKLLEHCKGNEVKMKNLKARLYLLVSEMYQSKRNPTQREINDEFYGKKVYFKIYGSHPNFTGRISQLDTIKEALTKCDGRGYLFDLLITGLGGMGKTQILRKYIEIHEHNHKNIIWINAETQESIENSFIELAKQCMLITNTKIPDIHSIVNAIYNHFTEDSLFIFDNASKILLNNTENDWHYLPNCKLNSNYFVVISQNRQWKANCIVEISKFTMKESILYLKKSIDSTVDKSELENLAITFDFWPLALCLAASYINQQFENLQEKSVSNFIKKFSDHERNLHEHAPQVYEMEPYKRTLLMLWELIENNLVACNGELAIKILAIFSFTHPDNLPIDMLKHASFTEIELQNALALMQNYSVVTINDDEMSIHRTLQSVIRNTITEDRQLQILEIGIQMFDEFLQKADKRFTIGNMHIVILWYHVLEFQDLVKSYSHVTQYVVQKLKLSYDLHIGKQFGTQCLQKLGNILSQNNEDFILTRRRFAELLILLGEYDEAEKETELVIQSYDSSNASGMLLIAFSRYVLCEILIAKGNYQRALEEINKTLEIQSKYLEISDSHTLTSNNLKGLVLYHMEKYEESLKLFDKVLPLKCKSLGNEHHSTLLSMNCKAMVLNDMGRNVESLELYEKVYSIVSKQLDKNHPNLLVIASNKARVMNDLGLHDEALELYDYILQESIDKFGDEHPNTLTFSHNRARVLKAKGLIDEALAIFSHVYEKRKELLGINHAHTKKSLDAINEIKNVSCK